MIKQRHENDQNLPSVSVQSVYFDHKIDRLGVEQGMEETSRWIKDDIMSKDALLIPIHKRDHWSLVGVDIKTRTTGKLMQSCPSDERTFVMKAEKEKHQKKEIKAKKVKNRKKPKADRAMKIEDHRKERIESPN